MLTKDPFTTAERYIQLRALCHSPSWGDTAIRANEMIIAPLIALYCLFTLELDFFMMGSAVMTAHRAWSEWFEFTDLQFEIQRMKLYTLVSGGPRIVTNDPVYMPYVYADAIARLNMRCLA